MFVGLDFLYALVFFSYFLSMKVVSVKIFFRKKLLHMTLGKEEMRECRVG